MQAIPFEQRNLSHAPLQTELADTRWGTIRKGMAVWGRDGKIGRVVLIVRDRHTREPAQLVVRRGWLWPRRLLIPLHWTVEILDDRITINTRLWQLAYLPEYRTDQQIAQATQEALMTSDVFLRQGDYAAIRVAVRDGIVTLRGNVRDGSRRFQAQALANGVLGVQELRNELIADDDLQRRVEHALVADPALSGPGIDLSVAVNLGLVQLRGCVPTVAQYEHVLAVVRHVSNARAIWDDLAVIPPREQQLQRSATAVETGRTGARPS